MPVEPKAMTAILLVEDDVPLIRLAAWFLTEAGFEVRTATLGAADAELGRADSPAIIVSNTDAVGEEKQSRFTTWKALQPGVRIVDLDPTGGSQPIPMADESLVLPIDGYDFIDAVQRVAAVLDGEP